MLSRDDEYRMQFTPAYLLGKKDLEQCELHNAVRQFEDAIGVSVKIEKPTDDDLRDMAQCHFLLASAYLKHYSERVIIDLSWLSFDLPAMKEQYETAIALLEKIETDNRTHKDWQDLADFYLGLAAVYFKQSEWLKVIECNNKVIINRSHVNEELTDDRYREIANIYRSSGNANFYMENWPQANYYYTLAVKTMHSVSSELTDQDTHNLADSYYHAALSSKKDGEKEVARALFLTEIETLGKVKNLNAEDFKAIHKAYIELKDLCPWHDPEREIFGFAANVFVSTFWSQTNFERLNSILYSFASSPNWQTTRIHESLSRLLQLLCNTCRLKEFPDSPFKQYLQNDTHLENLKQKMQTIREMKSNAIDEHLYELQERMQRLEIANQSLRSDVADLRKIVTELSAANSARVEPAVASVSTAGLFNQKKNDAAVRRSSRGKLESEVVTPSRKR